MEKVIRDNRRIAVRDVALILDTTIGSEDRSSGSTAMSFPIPL